MTAAQQRQHASAACEQVGSSNPRDTRSASLQRCCRCKRATRPCTCASFSIERAPCVAHLRDVVEIQQQRGVALEAVGRRQQRRERVLVRQKVLALQVAARAAGHDRCGVVVWGGACVSWCCEWGAQAGRDSSKAMLTSTPCRCNVAAGLPRCSCLASPRDLWGLVAVLAACRHAAGRAPAACAVQVRHQLVAAAVHCLHQRLQPWGLGLHTSNGERQR